MKQLKDDDLEKVTGGTDYEENKPREEKKYSKGEQCALPRNLSVNNI